MTEKLIRATKPKRCPICKHSPMQTVVVGLPSPELFDDPRYDCVGCTGMDYPVNPKWHCSKCDLYIWRKSDLDEVDLEELF